MSHLTGKKFAVMIGKLFNEYEFLYPYYRLKEAGAEVVIAAKEGGKKYKGENKMKVTSDKAFSELQATDLDGIVIAGGYGPDEMRTSADCLRLVKDMHEQKKLVAFICHAGWVPVSAGILEGKRCTSVINIKDDLVNAGAKWEDKEMVQDGNLISSRFPDDLPAFMRGILDWYRS